MFLLVERLQKTFRKRIELEQVIVTFRLKMKSWDQFQNKHGIKLNKVFSRFTKKTVGGEGKDYKHIVGVSRKSVQKCN